MIPRRAPDTVCGDLHNTNGSVTICIISEQPVKRKREAPGQSFLHGALILTAAILLVKVIGALFKIPLNWIISEDGMGYFSTAYNFYSPIFSLATAGFPIAIARLVSGKLCAGQLPRHPHDPPGFHPDFPDHRHRGVPDYGTGGALLREHCGQRKRAAVHDRAGPGHFVQLPFLHLPRVL